MDTHDLQRYAFPSFDDPMTRILKDIFHAKHEFDNILCKDWHGQSLYTKEAFEAYLKPTVSTHRQSVTLASSPKVTKVPLGSQPSVQDKPCLTELAPTPVSSTASVSLTSPASDPACETPVLSTIANNGNPLGSPAMRNLVPTYDFPAYTSTPSYTWTYCPNTESVRFRRVVSSTIPIVHTGTPTGDASSTTNQKRYSSSPSSSKPSANSRWTCNAQSTPVVVFHQTRKTVSPKPTCIPSLQLPPSGALSKDSVIPSSVHAYSQHGASSCPIWKPIYGAHSSLTYDSPAVCITKRHHDAIKLKLYYLHTTLLFAN
eukprot:jgi/Psemu1/14851/gm1.14851_g